MSSVSNGLYFLTLPLVSVMRVIYRKNTSCALSIHQKECRKSFGCALYIRCALSIEKYGNSGTTLVFTLKNIAIASQAPGHSRSKISEVLNVHEWLPTAVCLKLFVVSAYHGKIKWISLSHLIH